MAETIYIPAVISAVLSPNPASAGETVRISVAAIDVACVPAVQTATSGEFTGGEF